MPVPPPLNSICQDILKRLDALEVRESKIVQERLELKSRWNRSLAVTQLPNEILFHIFVNFTGSKQPQNSNDEEVVEDLPTFGLEKTELVKLMLVCRRWRDMARATPALWRTFDVGRSSGWMKLALVRSGDATIDVSFLSEVDEEYFSLLQPHCHRLRSLRMRSWSPYALRVIRNALPALEMLDIHSNPIAMKIQGLYTDLRIACQQFPNLRTLQLAHNIIPKDPLLYTRLRKLSLKACHFKDIVNLQQFVQILSMSACLEHLELDEFLQNLSDRPQNARPAYPLPASLRSLRLSDHIPVLSEQFLSLVIVPPTTSLSVKAYGGLPGLQEGFGSLRSVVPQGPSLANSLLGLAAVVWVRLTVTWNNKMIECYSTQPGQGEEQLINLRLAFAPSIDHGPMDSMEEGIADLVTIVGSAPLAHLEIIGQGSSVGTEMWARVFRAFPALVSLQAVAGGTLFDGLRDVSLASPGGKPIVCGELERISIHWFLDRAESPLQLFQRLTRCLRCRADRGSRLKKLLVCIDSHGYEDDIRTFLPRLEGLVEEVELR